MGPVQETVRPRSLRSGGGEASGADCRRLEDGRCANGWSRTRRRGSGGIDAAFNNAGIHTGVRIPFHEYPEDEWDRVIGVNLKGVWLCIKYEAPVMLEQGGGAIVNTPRRWRVSSRARGHRRTRPANTESPD